MFTPRQTTILVFSALLFWLAATAQIHFFPVTMRDPVWGSAVFLLSIPLCWRCIVAVRRYAALTPQQLVPGTAIVAAIAMLIDASALRWAHAIYSQNDTVARLGAAWLLWGYGVSLVCALVMARQQGRPGGMPGALPLDPRRA